MGVPYIRQSMWLVRVAKQITADMLIRAQKTPFERPQIRPQTHSNVHRQVDVSILKQCSLDVLTPLPPHILPLTNYS